MAKNGEDIVGKFEFLNSEVCMKTLAEVLYLSVLKYKDVVASELEDSHVYKMFETVEEATADKKKNRPAPTYKEKKVEKDRNGDVSIREVDSPKKKFTVVATETKMCLLFLFAKFMKESLDCFNKEKNKFEDTEKVLEQVSTYANKNSTLAVAPFIIKCMDVEQFYKFDKEDHQGSVQKIVQILSNDFRKGDRCQHKEQLGRLITTFLNFVKTIGVYASCLLLEKRQNFNVVLLKSILRMINARLHPAGQQLEQELLHSMEDWVEAHKSKAKSKNKEEEDEEENATKKKSIATKAAPKKNGKTGTSKSKGKGKKNESEEEANDIDSEQLDSVLEDAHSVEEDE